MKQARREDYLSHGIRLLFCAAFLDEAAGGRNAGWSATRWAVSFRASQTLAVTMDEMIIIRGWSRVGANARC